MANSARLDVRLDPADDYLIRRAAKVAGTTVSAFILASARATASNVLADQLVFPLDEQRWMEFKKRLDARPRRKPRLRKLATQPEILR
jgi:uncharacterized protein (DUF1778 family)